MSDHTKIEWADATVNAVNGCSVVSPGCTNCYAMRLAGTRMRHHPSRAGLTQPSKAGPVWNGEVRLSETALLQPFKWKRPRRIFWNPHGDLFHENVPDEWIDRVFAVCALTPQHTHMILTKRAGRMREYVAKNLTNGCGLDRVIGRDFMHIYERARRENWPLPTFALPLPNVWLGVSVEDQTRADERIPDLLATPAAVRFISAEPLLGPVDLRNVWEPLEQHKARSCTDALEGTLAVHWDGEIEPSPIQRLGGKLDWVICGGESGPGARPMHPDWARSLRDQCAAAGVAFHFKQWGEWHPGWDLWPTGVPMLHPNYSYFGERKPVFRIGKKHAGRLLDGLTHDEFPA